MLDGIAGGFFHCARVECARIDTALGQFADQHVLDLRELEIVIRKNHQHGFFALLLDFDAGVRALEVKAVGDFLVALVDRVSDFDLVDF